MLKVLGSLLAGVLVFGPPVASAPTTSVSQEVHGPPDHLASLVVKKEDVAKTLAQERRALYVDRVGLFSLRDPNNLLEATLEIGHFRSDAPWSTEDFQLSVVGHLGSVLPTIVRAGATPVYITTSKGLVIAVWFKQGHMMALAIRSTYIEPKNLLREALKINP